MKKYVPPFVQEYCLENKTCILSGSHEPPFDSHDRLEFCLKISDNKEDNLAADMVSIGGQEGLKMCVTLVDKLDYIYYIVQRSASQAVLLACINEKGEIYDTFKDWNDDKLKVLSSSAPNLIAMIQNGRLTRGDQVGLIPIQDKDGLIYDCATRVVDFDWNTDNHAAELGRCHSIACQILGEILKALTELNEGDISTSQKIKIGALSLSEAAQRAYRVARGLKLIDNVSDMI